MPEVVMRLRQDSEKRITLRKQSEIELQKQIDSKETVVVEVKEPTRTH